MEVDLKKDLYRITYNRDRVAPERMLETVRKQGFQGELVKGAAASNQTGGKARRDLDRLPEELRKEVRRAKQDGEPLLLAFHGPA